MGPEQINQYLNEIENALKEAKQKLTDNPELDNKKEQLWARSFWCIPRSI